MSRIGKQLIVVPEKTEVKIDGQNISVKGPKGELRMVLHRLVSAALDGQTLTIKVKNKNNREDRALWGLSASLVKNMVIGVNDGFSKKLEINGVGFNATAAGGNLLLNLGFSHPVNFAIPAGIEIKTAANEITVSGADKQLVGEITAQIRKLKLPEPYKGKGIKYSDEHLLRKAGKAAAAKS